MFPPVDVPAWFKGKSIEELSAIEAGGRVLIPDAIRTIGPKGDERLTRVMARVPTEQERALARIDAITHVARLNGQAMGAKATWTVDRAREVVGAEVFENIDTVAIVARCLLEPEPPHGPFMLLEVLIGSFPLSALFDMYERLDFYSRLFSPMVEGLDEEQFWGVVAAIASKRNLGPLAGMHGALQSAFITRMAAELSSCRPPSSSSPSSATSTPEP